MIADFQWMKSPSWPCVGPINRENLSARKCAGSFHREIHRRIAAALVTFDSHRDFVEASHLHLIVLPGVKVILHCDGAACAFRGADAPVLLESLNPLDRWLVHSQCLINIVRSAIARYCAHMSHPGWTERAPTIYDVIFDERIRCPSVDAQ